MLLAQIGVHKTKPVPEISALSPKLWTAAPGFSICVPVLRAMGVEAPRLRSILQWVVKKRGRALIGKLRHLHFNIRFLCSSKRQER